jgi:methionyl-tRNA formyltransferase
MAMKLVFCGTPQFAVPTLEALVRASHQLSLVVTQPDRPRGRGMELAASPVKQKAIELGLPLTQPEKIKTNADFRAQLEAIAADCIIVVGYGRIIPRWMLDLPRFGNINLHASLLPKYRGAAPIQWAIASGETVTGNTTMLLNEGLDTGDVLVQREMAIPPDATSITLAPPLAAMGAELVIETLDGFEHELIEPVPQEHDHHTLAPILTKDDGRIQWSRTAPQIYNRFRGFQPWPGAFTNFRGRQIAIHAMRPLPSGETVFGQGVLAVECDRLVVGCGETSALEILELQMEGKKRMSARDFINGYQLQPDEKLG